jgi:peptide deformylase
MSILKVARMGHPVLRRPARPVDKSDVKSPLFQKLVDDMIETMHEYHGVGLAAPQVHEGLRLFVALLDEEPDSKSAATVIINPRISPLTDTSDEGWEGCLSIPDIRGRVPRCADIGINALDRQGRSIELQLTKFPARVFQHEADHLDGVLFFDRMRSMETLTYLDEFSKYWAKEDEDADE